MTIFRSKKDGKLYVIYEVFKSFRMTYKRYQAVPYPEAYNLYHYGAFDVSSLKDFEEIAVR